jgi:hypothetical protein
LTNWIPVQSKAKHYRTCLTGLLLQDETRQTNKWTNERTTRQDKTTGQDKTRLDVVPMLN